MINVKHFFSGFYRIAISHLRVAGIAAAKKSDGLQMVVACGQYGGQAFKNLIICLPPRKSLKSFEQNNGVQRGGI